MSPENARFIDDLLGTLSPDQRVGSLVVAIMLRRPEVVRAIVSLLANAAALSEGLPFEQRVMLAEVTRDTADVIEKRERVAV